MTDKVTNLFSEVLLIDVDSLSAESDPSNTKEWDSLANMMLIAAIEETFSVELSISDIESMKSLGNVQAILKAKGVDIG